MSIQTAAAPRSSSYRLGGVAALLVAFLGSPQVRAQDAREQPATPTPAPAPAPEPVDADIRSSEIITVPEALNTPVPPIEGTTARVEIVLELFIDREGHVLSARPVGGREPYATAATEATKAWSFRPATKGGQPVAAIISYLVTYEPEPAVEASQAEKNTAGSPNAPATEPPRATGKAHATAIPVQEVVILGELPDPGTRTWTRADSGKLAGSFDDPLRSLEVMPGVTPIITGLPLFFVRGAPPGNIGWYLEGIRVPQLYHGFLGPSVVQPEFIAKVDLHAGPMPARYGRYAGAAVEGRMEQPQGTLRAKADVSLFDVGGFAEAPIAGGRGYAMAGARYSVATLLLGVLAPGVRVDYWDYQALVGYRLGKHDEMRAFAFGSFDYFNANPFVGGLEFHRVDLGWTHHFGKKARLKIATTGGSDRSRSDLGFFTDTMFQTRISYTLTGQQAILRTGGDISIDVYGAELDPTIQEPEVYAELFPPRTDATGGAYVDMVLFPRSHVRVVPGLRGDVYSSLGDVMAAADVRLAAEYDLLPWLKSRHAVGTAHQAPTFVPNVPGLQVGGLRGGLQESIQASSTFDFALPWAITASIGGFASVTTNLSDPISASQSFSVDENSADVRMLGRALGLETELRRPLTRRIGFLLSYTLSTTLRSDGDIATLAGYDRPHMLNGAFTYDLGRHWQASVKGVLGSGIPGRRTTLDGFVYDGERSAPIARLDLKLAKRWYVSEHFNWGLYAEVLNATNSGSVSRRTCGRMGCVDEGTAPFVFPNLGVDLVWN